MDNNREKRDHALIYWDFSQFRCSSSSPHINVYYIAIGMRDDKSRGKGKGKLQRDVVINTQNQPQKPRELMGLLQRAYIQEREDATHYDRCPLSYIYS